MAYKGILYDNNKFEIIEYNDPNAKYEMQNSYSFIENGKSGIFIVRKTKEEVLQSFLKKFIDKIAKSTEDIINYKKILKIINDELNR